MNFKQTKEAIKNYRDFWGLEIHYQEDIENSKTYEELNDVLLRYYQHIEDMATDAKKHLDGFVNKLGIINKY